MSTPVTKTPVTKTLTVEAEKIKPRDRVWLLYNARVEWVNRTQEFHVTFKVVGNPFPVRLPKVQYVTVVRTVS